MNDIKLENEKIMCKMGCNEEQKVAFNNINNIIAKYNDGKIVPIGDIPEYVYKYTFDMTDHDKLAIMKNNKLVNII